MLSRYAKPFALAAMFLVVSHVQAQDLRPEEPQTEDEAPKKKTSKGKKTPSATFVLIDVDGTLQIAGNAAEVTTLRRDLREKYKEDLKLHRDAKSQAKKNKEKFTDKPPVRGKLRIVKRNLASREAAEAAMEKELAARERKLGTFSVVLIGDELQLIRGRELAKAKKEALAKYRSLRSAWQKSQREAKKAKTEFTDPAPKEPNVVVLAKGIATRDEGDAKLEELEERRASGEKLTPERTSRKSTSKKKPEKVTKKPTPSDPDDESVDEDDEG